MSHPNEPDYLENDDTSDDFDNPGPTRLDYVDYTGHSTRSPPKQRSETWKAELEQSGDVAQRVLAVLSFMKLQHIDLPILLDALCWSNEELRVNAEARFERTALTGSEDLPRILRHCAKPPRSHNRGIKTKGAHDSLLQFALDYVVEQMDCEFNALARQLHAPRAELSQEQLLSVTMDGLRDAIQASAPTVLQVFTRAAYSERQKKVNKAKNPEKAVISMISQASFMRSHHRNRFHKLLSIFLKGCGLSAKAFDTLHAFGLTMSQKWTYDGIDTLSTKAHGAMLEDIHQYPFSASHDNLNIGFKVQEQRLMNQNHFDSGTAGTIYIAKDPDTPQLNNSRLREQRADGSKQAITGREIVMLEKEAAPRIQSRHVHRVLRFLLEAKDFALSSYSGRDDPCLQAPPPVNELPAGAEHRTTQYMLKTKHIEEASYEGNDRLMREWFRQLGMSDIEEMKKTGLERVIVWIGDQLTVSRLRGLSNFRAEDFNAFDRMDWLVPVYGWFHKKMTFASSLHSQYYGTRSGRGLAHAFDNLHRKGLHSPSVQGTFHHNLEEALYHVGEAHFRDLWLQVAGVRELSSLRGKQPAELRALAEEIVRNHASRNALIALDQAPKAAQDELRRVATQWNADVLDYYELDDAMHVGDVGRMEDMLPRLLFRFAGGKNSKYSHEVLELLQCLHKEWPDEVKNFVRRHCWLVNTTGRRNGFCPVDLAQEHNVRDIKYTFAAMGPGATWDYIGKISPAIPVIRAVKDHVDAEFNPYSRYKHHTTPDKENDVKLLCRLYGDSKVHQTEHGRKFRNQADRAPDTMANGAKLDTLRGLINRWWDNRVHERSTDELWSDSSSEHDD